MKAQLTFRLEDRNDFISVLMDRVPSVGEIIHMTPVGTYRVSEIRNLMERTSSGLALYISTTVVYCIRLDENLEQSPANADDREETGISHK